MDFAVCRTQEVSALLSCRSSIGRRQLRGCVGVTQKPGDQVTTNPLFFFLFALLGVLLSLSLYIIIIYYFYYDYYYYDYIFCLVVFFVAVAVVVVVALLSLPAIQAS